jgi:hypothetical protein
MSIFKNIWKLIKRVLGFPPAPTPEQLNEVLITMREDRDCAVAAVATACGTAMGVRCSYELASRALWHWNLPWFFESPLLSNPPMMQRGMNRLGCKVRSVKISELLRGELKPGAVICLMHDPSGDIAGTIGAHWVVWFGKDATGHLFHWGKSQKLRTYSEQDTVDMLTSGWPNALYEVSA